MSGEKIVILLVGVLLVAVVLWAVLFGPYKDSDLGPIVLRAVLAVGVGALVMLLSGKLLLKLPLGVQATGAVGAFVLVFLVNPPDVKKTTPTQPAPRIKHSGYLGDLHDTIQRDVADTEFLLELGTEHRLQLRQFWVFPEITAKDHGELLRKICRRYSECLRCEPDIAQIQKTVKVSWRSAPAPLSSAPGESPHYTCNAAVAAAPADAKTPQPEKPEQPPTDKTPDASEPKVTFGTPIYEVAANHPARAAAPTVGQIVLASNKTCTAFLISRNQALTTGHCVVNQTGMRMLLGYHSATEKPTEYPVAAISEINHDLDYAILTIAGKPGDSYGSLAPKAVAVQDGTAVTVIHHSQGKPLALSEGKITGMADSQLYYDTPTSQGSGGAPILSASGELLGLHVGSKTGDGKMKEGITIAAILAKSALLAPPPAPVAPPVSPTATQ